MEAPAGIKPACDGLQPPACVTRPQRLDNELSGSRGRARTCAIPGNNRMLYLLSYTTVVDVEGLEPPKDALPRGLQPRAVAAWLHTHAGGRGGNRTRCAESFKLALYR